MIKWLSPPSRLWQRELLVVVRSPRIFLIKVLTPLILGLPLLLAHAPTFWVATLLTTLVAMVGGVGAAMALVRARSSGYFERLALLPRSSQKLLLQWVFAAALVDVAQFLPLWVAILIIGNGTLPDMVALLAIVASALLFTNVLGSLLSLVAGGPGDVLVTTVVVLAPLLFFAGLFTGVPAYGIGAWVAAIDPFTYASSGFVDAVSATGTFSAGVIVLASAVVVAAVGFILAAVSPFILERA